MKVLIFPGGGLTLTSQDGPRAPSGGAVVDLPPPLAGVDPSQLVYDGTALRNRADIATWYVDANGGKSAVAAPGLQAVACAWGAALVRGADGTWSVAPASSALLAYAQAKWQRAIAGGTVTVGGFSTGTDESSQGYVSRTIQLMQLANVANVAWNGNPATPISLAQLQALGVALGTYVQAAFNTLGRVQAAVSAGTITTTAQIDAPPAPVPAWPAVIG